MTLVGDASSGGWRLVARDMGLDTTTPEGEMVAGALTMAARFEARRIGQRPTREAHVVPVSSGNPDGASVSVAADGSVEPMRTVAPRAFSDLHGRTTMEE